MSNESIRVRLTAVVDINEPTVTIHVLMRTELDGNLVLAAGDDGGVGCTPEEEADGHG